MADMGPEQMEKMLVLGEKMISAMGKLSDKVDDVGTSVEKTGKKAKKFTDIGSKGSEELRKNTEDYEKSLLKLNDVFDETAEKIKDLTSIKGLDPKLLEDYTKKAEELRAKIEGLKEAGAGTWEIAKAQADFEKLREGAINSKDAIEEMAKKGKLDMLGKGVGSAVNMFKALGGTRGNLKDAASSAMGMSQQLKGAGGSLMEAGGASKLLGGAMKGLGASVGGIAKMFAGWPGMILMAIKAVVDIGLKVDQFVKDANKSFARVRGPDIMGRDTEQQFLDFNKQIFMIRENLRVGLNVNQIREFTEALSATGVIVPDLNKSFTSYRDAIYVASKASKTLGVDMVQISAWTGKMMTDYKMSLSEVDKTFVNVAFEAKKAGLNTDRFWQAIQNSSASLSFYGKFINAAAKSLRAFSESQIAGAEEAQKASTEMMQLFGKSSLETNTMIAQFAKEAGYNFDKAFEDVGKNWQLQAEAIEAEVQQVIIAKGDTAETREEISKLRKQQAAYENKAMRAQSMVGKNAVEQATELAMLTDKTPSILTSVLKQVAEVGSVTEIQGEKMWVALKAMEKMGMSKETARMMIESMQANARLAENILEIDEKGNMKADGLADILTSSYTLSDSNADEMARQIEALKTTTNPELQIKATEKISDVLHNSFAEITGMDKDQANKLSEMIRSSGSLQRIFQDYSKASIANDEEAMLSIRERISSLIKSGKLGDEMFTYEQEETNRRQAELEKNARMTMHKIVTQTLSAKEALEIAKNGVEWQANMFAQTYAIGRWVKAIGVATRAKDPEAEANRKELTKMGIATENSTQIMNATNNLLLQIKDADQEASDIFKKILEKQDVIAKYDGDIAKLDQDLANATDKTAKAQISSKIEGKKQAKSKAAMDLKSLEMEKAAAEERKTQAEGTIEKLKSLDEGSSEQISILTELLLTTPEGQKRTYEKMLDLLKGKKKITQDDITDAFVKAVPGLKKETLIGAGASDLLQVENIQKMLEESGLGKKLVGDYNKKTGKTEYTIEVTEPAGTTIATQKTQQGLTEPLAITTSGSMILHTGEVLLPKSFADVSTVPIPTIPGMPAGPAAGGGAPLNINITVNATMKDLASTIASEVKTGLRSSLYELQLTGAA